jgi:hypothetical protein
MFENDSMEYNRWLKAKTAGEPLFTTTVEYVDELIVAPS